MKSELELQPNCSALIKVEIPAERLSAERVRVTGDFSKQARLPGFRPGKAPAAMVAKRFKTEIEEEVNRALVSEGYREAVKENGLKVLSLADITDIEVGVDQILRFTAKVFLQPEFELPDYRSIQIPAVEAVVSEEEVSEMIDNLRDQQASFNDVAPLRPLAMSDFAVIDYTGTIDGQPVSSVVERGGDMLSKREDFWLLMGDDSFLPGFCPNLAGVSVGDVKEFDLTLPGDFPIEVLRDKTLHFTVTLKGIKERILPEVNDEFAGKVLPGSDLAKLTAMIRTQLASDKTRQEEQRRRNAIVEELLRMTEFDVPDVMVHQETRRILADIMRENEIRGIPAAQMGEQKEEIVQGALSGAKTRVKSTFLLVRIAEKEGLTVSKAELDARIQSLARRFEMTPAKLRERLEKNDSLGSIHEEMLVTKVLDFLASGGSVPGSAPVAEAPQGA